MFYALVYYPDIDADRINRFRRKYDPQVDLIKPHITLIFPLPQSIGEDNLVSHIESVLSGKKQFPIYLRGLERSWDNFLFLILQAGSAEVIGLHDELYTGLIAEYRREDIAFLPHVTLGLFDTHALEEARRLDLGYRCVVDRLHLVKINDNRSQIVCIKEFLLQK